MKGLLALPAIENIEEIVQGLTIPVELTKGSYKNVEFHFKDSQVTLIHDGVDIKDFSNVWLSSTWKTRDLAYAVRLYLKKHKTPHTFVEKVTSKLTDQMKFALKNIPFPDTLFVDPLDVAKHVNTIEKVCGFPLIIKDILGSHGKNSLFVSNKEELVMALRGLSKRRKYIYQSFIPNDFDWGVLVSNGVVVSAEMSFPVAGEFRNNCNGAEERFVDVKDVPEEVKNIAIRASKALNLKWSRSDIVVDRNSGKAYLMEVNRLPGVTSSSNEIFGAQHFLSKFML